MKIKQILNYKIKRALDISLILILAVAISCMISGGKAAGAAEGDNIIASGDGFVMTQKDVAAFQDLLAKDASLPQREVVRIALRYELLSREYQKEEKGPKLSGDSDERMSAAEMKMRNGNIYIQKVLQDHVVSNAVIESYYRSHPKKYSLGQASDGKYILIPLDENIKKDIIFTIVEANKEVIIKKKVDGLIAKYHIQIQAGI